MVNINVHILGDLNNESKAALSLRELIQNTLPLETSGTIDIIPNVTIPNGKVADIDILVVGQLQNCFITSSLYGQIEVKSFVTVIEIKEQNENDVYVTETEIRVSYPSSGTTKLASQQNRDQKYSLLNYITYKEGSCPFKLSNMVWLKSISENILIKKIGQPVFL